MVVLDRSPVLRPALPGDAAAIRALDGLGRSTLRLLDRDLADADHVVVVAQAGRRLVGVALGMLLLDQLHVTDLAVDPAVRGRGLGAGLLVRLLETGAVRGATSATLEVRPSNDAALALYRSVGFVEEGRRAGYYPADGGRPAEDAVIMWRHDLQGTTAPREGAD